jgi:hypothetical protein
MNFYPNANIWILIIVNSMNSYTHSIIWIHILRQWYEFIFFSHRMNSYTHSIIWIQILCMNSYIQVNPRHTDNHTHGIIYWSISFCDSALRQSSLRLWKKVWSSWKGIIHWPQYQVHDIGKTIFANWGSLQTQWPQWQSHCSLREQSTSPHFWLE